MENAPIWFLVILIGCIFGFALLAALVLRSNDFSHELRHLNNDIVRTAGDDQRYLKRQKADCGYPSFRLSDTGNEWSVKKHESN